MRLDLGRFFAFGAEAPPENPNDFVKFGELKSGDIIGDPNEFRGIGGKPVMIKDIVPDGRFNFAFIEFEADNGEKTRVFRDLDQKIRLIKRD